MEQTVLPYVDGAYVTSISWRDNGSTEANYDRWIEGGVFYVSGIVDIQSVANERRLFRFRQEYDLPSEWSVFDSSFVACVEGNEVSLLIEESVRPGGFVETAFSYWVTLRRSADFNDDGLVDSEDLGLFLLSWGSDDFMYDLNRDGIVDGVDLGLLFMDWNWSL
tara:strand:+ start:2615 stop:3106 length:492 start_codon:yes stop_codon:yes gene_type:complete